MRVVVRFVLALVIILGIAWLGLWWYAEGRMESGFTNWADQLATQGWKVSYNTAQRGTSPARAELTLTDLSLSPPPDAQGRTGTISLPSVSLRIEALDPLELHTDLPSQITIDLGNAIDAAITFSSISLTEQLDTQVLFNHAGYPYRSGDFAATGVDILASEGSLLVLHLDRMTTHFAVNPQASSTAQALNVTEALDGIAVSPLMTHLLSIPFDGRITHLGLNAALSGPVPPGLPGLAAQLKALPINDEAGQQKLLVPIIHSWAEGNGSGGLSLTGVVGPTTIDSDATIKFDGNLQPTGTADLTANHLDQLFAALSNAYPELQNDIAQVEAELSNYLTADPAGGQTLAMHATFGNGEVTVNGQKTAPLPPVNWDALANPPPPAQAPEAPGDGSGAAAPSSQ
jgi:hypothetical protein